MTQEIYAQNLKEILNNKNKIERELRVRITNQGRNVFIEGDAENEYLCLRMIEAINLGFSLEQALTLKNEETILHILNIRDVTRRKDLERIRARLIGSQGKTRENMENLSDCMISVHDNWVGIIGEVGCIDEAIISIKLIIQGSKQGNVYARLEKKKKERRLKPLETIKRQRPNKKVGKYQKLE